MELQEVKNIIATIPGVVGKDLKTTFGDYIRIDNRLLKTHYATFEAGLIAHVILEAKKAGLIEELTYSTKSYQEMTKIMYRLQAVRVTE